MSARRNSKTKVQNASTPTIASKADQLKALLASMGTDDIASALAGAGRSNLKDAMKTITKQEQDEKNRDSIEKRLGKAAAYEMDCTVWLDKARERYEVAQARHKRAVKKVGELRTRGTFTDADVDKLVADLQKGRKLAQGSEHKTK